MALARHIGAERAGFSLVETGRRNAPVTLATHHCLADLHFMTVERGITAGINAPGAARTLFAVERTQLDKMRSAGGTCCSGARRLRRCDAIARRHFLHDRLRNETHRIRDQGGRCRTLGRAGGECCFEALRALRTGRVIAGQRDGGCSGCLFIVSSVNQMFSVCVTVRPGRCS